MMKISKFNFIFIATMIIVLILSIIGWQVSKLYTTPDNFYCSSRQTVLHGNFKLEANYTFRFSVNEGEMAINGIVTEGEKTNKINKIISFDFTKADNIYILTSTNIESLSTDQSKTSNFDHHFPSFFHQTKQKLMITLLKDKYYNNVLYVYGRPVFYCKKYTSP